MDVATSITRVDDKHIMYKGMLYKMKATSRQYPREKRRLYQRAYRERKKKIAAAIASVEKKKHAGR